MVDSAYKQGGYLRSKGWMGIVCLTAPDEQELAVITPVMVRREMQRLAWPAAELEVQPPDGQTLVNFDTNFFTNHTHAVTRTITLPGQRVTIEATPVEYHWHFGDGATRVTTSPGRHQPPRPVPDQHRPGRKVPGSLTVQGDTVHLRIRSATPHLVGSDSRG